MSNSFFISTRNVRNGQFGNENGKPSYIMVSNEVAQAAHDAEDPRQILQPANRMRSREWFKNLMDTATLGHEVGWTVGDIVVYVHGYSNSLEDVLARHLLLDKKLKGAGFPGVLISFDWPSADNPLNYLEDRDDANDGAIQLVTAVFKPLALYQRNRVQQKCGINVHLLGHSTGAYVIRNGFRAASDAAMQAINWNVGQVLFIAADISSKSMNADSDKSRFLFEKATRITNYVNPCDSILKLSNAKRLGFSRRLGRVGLPDDPPESCVDVFCHNHWRTLEEPDDAIGSWSHSWHFYSDVWIEDCVHTLMGDLDRRVIPTRQRCGEWGHLELVPKAPSN